MLQGRMDKTRDKMRRGGLPAPTSDRPSVESGNGRRRDGCGEVITQVERMAALIISNVVVLRLHEECYTAWSTFTRYGACHPARFVSLRGCPLVMASFMESQSLSRSTGFRRNAVKPEVSM